MPAPRGGRAGVPGGSGGLNHPFVHPTLTRPFVHCHLSPLASPGACSPGCGPGLAGPSEGAAATPAWGGSPRPLPSPRAGRGRPRTNPLAPSAPALACRRRPTCSRLPSLPPGPAGCSRRTWQRGTSVPPAALGDASSQDLPRVLLGWGRRSCRPRGIRGLPESGLRPNKLISPPHSTAALQARRRGLKGERGVTKSTAEGSGAPGAPAGPAEPGFTRHTRRCSGYYIKEVTQAGLFRVLCKGHPSPPGSGTGSVAQTSGASVGLGVWQGGAPESQPPSSLAHP